MPTSNTIHKVRELLAEGQTEPAADLLLQLAKAADPAHHQSALLLKNRVETLQHNVIEGVLSQSEERVEWARVSKGIMELTVQMERQEKPLPETETRPAPPKPTMPAALRWWLAALSAAVLLGLFLVPKLLDKNPAQPRPVRPVAQLTGHIITASGQPAANARLIVEGLGEKLELETDGLGVFKIPETALGKQVSLTIIHNGEKKIDQQTFRLTKEWLGAGLPIED